MNRVKKTALMLAAAANAIAGIGGAFAHAANYTWANFAGGTYTWTDPLNWSSGAPGSPAYPNVVVNATPTAVNDSANISGAITGGTLSIAIPAGSVGVTTLTLGATGSAFNTDIGAGNLLGGILFFGQTNTNGSSTVSVSNGTINSGGVAGVSNFITAPIQLNGTAVGNLNVTGTSTLTLSGGLRMNENSKLITNSLTGGAQLIYGGTTNLYDVTTPLTSRNITITGAANSTTVINGTFLRGDGATTGNAGNVAVGSTGSPATTTYIMNAAQTVPAIEANKGTYILGNNAAMGVGTIGTRGSNNNNWGTELQSNDDARTIANNILSINSFAFTGNNSITVTGFLSQSTTNTAVGNALAAGKLLTLNGAGNGVAVAISNLAGDGNRTWIFDGPGKTVVTGLVINNNGNDAGITGAFAKRGSGTVVLSNAGNTYKGATTVSGGLLEFSVAGAWGATSGITVNDTGAVWFTPGSANAGFNTFLQQIVSSSIGALAIPASEAATNFNFTLGDLGTSASLMSIGAQGNVTYTGTVTPSANGYSWGGVMGTLTLNGNNRMIGANNVRYANGGTVIVNGTQSYTGVTTIAGGNMVTNQNGIASKSGSATAATNVLFTTTVEIPSISNGGTNSSLGASSNDPANLVFNGGTLRYVGAPNGSTDRLFSIGTLGAGIDSSGAGSLTLANPGSHVSFGNGNRTLTLSGSNTGDNTISGLLSDAGVGSVLAIAKTGAGKWILAASNTMTGTLSVNGGTLIMNKMPGGAATISAGQLQIAPKGTPNSSSGTSVVPSLTIAASGASIDLTNNSMVINYTGAVGTLVGDIRGHLRNGRLITTAASPANTRLGYLDNATLGIPKTSFGGVSVDATSVLVKFTYSGDGDLDGDADGVDIGTWATNFTGELGGGASATRVWAQGDWDYDGDVDGIDAGLWAQAFTGELGGTGLGSVVVDDPAISPQAASILQGMGVTVVPEPAIGSLATAFAACSLGRRRSRRRS